MRQIRQMIFETNSSSTHSLTIMMKDDYDRWGNENLYMFDGWLYNFRNNLNKPVKGALYTKDEVVQFEKNSGIYDDEALLELNDEDFKDDGFVLFENSYNEYLESFYKEFTTPSGETIVAFGQYGYDY